MVNILYSWINLDIWIYSFYFVDTLASTVDTSQKLAQSAVDTGKTYATSAKGKSQKCIVCKSKTILLVYFEDGKRILKIPFNIKIVAL